MADNKLVTLKQLKDILLVLEGKIFKKTVNKDEIDEGEALAVLAETDIVQPVADENNAVFLDENKAVYIL